MYTLQVPQATTSDTAAAVLAWLHRLLLRSTADQPSLVGLLEELADVFQVPAIGLASLPDGRPLLRYPTPAAPDQVWPWQENPELLVEANEPARATYVEREADSLLVTTLRQADGTGWVLWLEGKPRDSTSDAEAAALSLVGQFLAGRIVQFRGGRWARQLDRAARQQRLETAAEVTRRVAHDFGNVLTGILGFSELALTQQVAVNSPLYTYLTEVHRAAQSGAQYTHLLRLFSRNQSTSSRPCSPRQVLAEEEARLFTAQPKGLQVNVSLPENLPQVALDAESLHQVLGALLDNAREALMGAGAISVSARTVELGEAECLELYGKPSPGPHVEITIVDTGVGLTPEAEQKLFAEPFFTTKARRRGFGLMVAFGILCAHKGGLRLHAGEEHGVVARLLLPVARVNATASTGAKMPTAGERLLVVDDEPEVLNLVASSLQQAGYRVTTASDGELALQTYLSQGADPFRLVLADVVMPGLGGVEMVRRMLRRDPDARVLFMSGHSAAGCTHQEVGRQSIDLLAKPFRPEQLLKAVQKALHGCATTPQAMNGRQGRVSPVSGLTGT